MKIADSAKIQSEIASKQSQKADIKGWISVVIAFLLFFLNCVDAWDYFKNIPESTNNRVIIDITNPTSETVIFGGFFSFFIFPPFLTLRNTQ